VRGVEKLDRLLALELARLSLDLAFLDFASDFIFAAEQGNPGKGLGRKRR